MAKKKTTIPPLIGGSRPIIKELLIGFFLIFFGVMIAFAIFRTFSVPDTRPEFGEIIHPAQDMVEGSTEENNENISAISDSREDEEMNIIESMDEVASSWVPNDLFYGEIIEDTYEVQYQDTLWEIAEAKYGSGFEWERIRSTNDPDIGYLPNGSQALIFPGQRLSLPPL